MRTHPTELILTLWRICLGNDMSTLIKHNRTKSKNVPGVFHFDEISSGQEQPIPDAPLPKNHWENVPHILKDKSREADCDCEEKLKREYDLLQKTIEQIKHLQQQWQAESHQQVLKLAIAISQRIVRGQIEQEPDISERWIREALELLSTSRRLRIFLHPADCQSLGTSAEQIAEQVAPLATVDIVADEKLRPGECRVEADHGLVDQSVESQLQRIFSELDNTQSQP